MNKSLGRKIAAYGVGAAAAALASSAQADIHYSGPIDISGDTIYFDLFNTAAPSTSMQDPAHNFELSSKKNGQKPKATGLSSTNGIGEVASFSGDKKTYTPEFAAGDTIGSNLSFSSVGYLNNFYGGSGGGEWNVGDTGFLGLQITVGTDVLYGWAEISLNNGGTPSTELASLNDASDLQFTLLGYAFEDSGAPIQAGAIPEPSSIALLAVGAAGVVALRRRKK